MKTPNPFLIKPIEITINIDRRRRVTIDTTIIVRLRRATTEIGTVIEITAVGIGIEREIGIDIIDTIDLVRATEVIETEIEIEIDDLHATILDSLHHVEMIITAMEETTQITEAVAVVVVVVVILAVDEVAAVVIRIIVKIREVITTINAEDSMKVAAVVVIAVEEVETITIIHRTTDGEAVDFTNSRETISEVDAAAAAVVGEEIFVEEINTTTEARFMIIHEAVAELVAAAEEETFDRISIINLVVGHSTILTTINNINLLDSCRIIIIITTTIIIIISMIDKDSDLE